MILKQLYDLLATGVRAPSPSSIQTVPLVAITRPADTNAYTANDAFANSTTVPTAGGFVFVTAARQSGGSGRITDAVITVSGGTAYQGELWIFDSPVTPVADNAAFTVSDSEVQTLVGVIPFNTTDTTAANAISYVNGLEFGFTCLPNSRNLYFLVKILNAPTPANAEVLTVRIKVQN